MESITPWKPSSVSCVGCHRVLQPSKSAWGWTCVCGCENDYFNEFCINLQCRKHRPNDFRPLYSCTFCHTMMTLPAPVPLPVQAPQPPPPQPRVVTTTVTSYPTAQYVVVPQPQPIVTGPVLVTSPRYVTTVVTAAPGQRTVSCPFCSTYVNVPNTVGLSTYSCGRCANIFRA